VPSLLRPMRSRDTTEQHRASTPLELFFDLTFVVAVSLAAVELAHSLEAEHFAHGLGSFAQVFFAIWWGWLNFTWFASAYDTDDWLYRVVTLMQMGGALTVAAGIPRAFEHEQYGIVVIGYVIMRLALVFQWLRAARSDRDRRTTALRYAAGITFVQALWIARGALPDELGGASFAVLVLAELSVPVIAEWQAPTAFHPGHIAERYGLFTIIVLGEGVLATGNSVIESIQDGKHVAALVALAIGGLALLAGMWWLYFSSESADTLDSAARTFAWGYGHYVIFAAAAAVSSGLEVQIAFITGHAELDELGARLVIAVPAAVFVVLVWALVVRPGINAAGSTAATVGAAVLLALAFVPWAVQVATIVEAGVLAAIVGALVGSQRDDDAVSESGARA